MDTTVLIGLVCVAAGLLLGYGIGWWFRNRRKMTFEEWEEPYWSGWAAAIKIASNLVEECGFDDKSRPFATRFAKHIRGLNESIPRSIRETQK